jgi:hypothetical protein
MTTQSRNQKKKKKEKNKKEEKKRKDKEPTWWAYIKSYMIPHAIPPKYIGVTIDQSTIPATADQPNIAPQLKVRAVGQLSSPSPLSLSGEGGGPRKGGRTEEYLGIICYSLH